MRALALVALMTAVASAQPTAAPGAQPGVQPEPELRTPFDQGRFGLSGGGGAGTAFGERYYAIALGASYFVLDGVGVGLASQVQWGNGPTITRVTPELRYVAQPLVGRWPLIPYAGVFYSHWFISSVYADVDAIGTRGGLLYLSGSIIVGLGIAYEHLVSECSTDCSSVYPDITIGFSL